jgi:uncharacterized protein
MNYRILGQLTGPRGQAECPIDAPVPPGTGQEWSGPVRGKIDLEKAGEELLASGKLQATVLLPCSRCAVVHPVPLDLDIRETVALRQVDEPEAYEEEEGPAPIPILAGDAVDLSELVRQMLVLGVPARSLCRPDCRGLCPSCGQDLNQTACDCGVQEIDPRLEALRDLL